MRNEPKVLLMMLFIASRCAAEPIRFDEIPASATGYAHFDVDRLLSSRLVAHYVDPRQLAAQMEQRIGGQVASLTIYSRAGGGSTTGKLVVLLRARGEKFFQTIESASAKAPDAVVFNYGSQKVYYSSAGQAELLNASMPTTRESSNPEPVYDKPPKTRGSIFWLGMDGADADLKQWTSGPSYLAFVGKNLIIGTTDMRSMADALDVLSGKSPSLAREDPRGLKANLSAGAMLVGAGLTAGFKSDDLELGNEAGSTTKPVAEPPTGFGLNMFGTFNSRAKLARFALGEDDQSEYVHLSFSMVDAASAEQLKNLIVGVMALISLSQVDQKPLIEPLLVQTDGATVTLQWSWPTAKLDELTRLAQGQTSGPRRPSTTRAASSAR